MRELLERLRVPLLFILLIVASLVALASDPRLMRRGEHEEGWWSGVLLEIAAPIQKTFSLPADAVGDLWSRYVALVELRAENARLRARLAQVQEQNLQFSEALVAGGRLQRIAEMRDDFDVPMQPAEVVGENVSPWFRSVLLDRGRRHQVRSGMPVVTDQGLVGLVTATAPHAARSTLLLDRQSSVDGIMQRSRARGIVHGRGSAELEFVFLVRGDDVQVGDVVITSGMGGVYPKGLRIGEVVTVSADPDRLVHTASLRPAVDFGRLEQVFVMLRRGPTLDLLHRGDGDGPS